jgi:hypothetical protein
MQRTAAVYAAARMRERCARAHYLARRELRPDLGRRRVHEARVLVVAGVPFALRRAHSAALRAWLAKSEGQRQHAWHAAVQDPHMARHVQEGDGLLTGEPRTDVGNRSTADGAGRRAG